jgi:flavodoxin I
MKELYDAAQAAGATLVGEVSTEGYTYDDSEAVVDGNLWDWPRRGKRGDKTEARIDAWLPTLGL